jgi:putative membrane protein
VKSLIRSAKRRAKNIAGDNHDIGKSIFAGLIGGLIGTIVMTEFQNALTKAPQLFRRDHEKPESNKEESQNGQKQGEDATMKAAGKIAKLAGHRPSYEQKARLGPVVHYSFGTLQGAVYATVLEMSGVQSGFIPALAFGAGLFVLADEIAVPALGLSGKPSESSLSSHLFGFASHLVYGISTDIATRGLRAAL